MHWNEVGPGASERFRLAVIGDMPDSQLLYQAFLAGIKAMEIEADVQLLDCGRDEFQECVAHLQACGFQGVSVGNPHKPIAAKLATGFFIVRHALGVANALSLGENIYAQNTEVPAFCKLIAGIPPATALVMGSGRAARSAVMGLYESGWQVKLWNRNLQRSKPLVSLFVRYGNIQTVPQPDPSGCSLIVNATPLGRKAGEEPPLIWRYARPKTTLVDYVYRNVATEFIRAGVRHGFQTIDGRELLIEQAAFALEWWHQRQAPREPMLEAIGFKKPVIPA